MFGWLATVTVTCAVTVHPKASPVTVYVIVEDGLAVTLAPVVELRFVAGDHVYVLAPLAVSVALCPMQMVGFGVTVTTGIGFTVTVTCAVAVHPRTSPVTVYVVVVVGFAVTVAPVVELKPVAGDHE
jgi:hypothetical protein